MGFESLLPFKRKRDEKQTEKIVPKNNRNQVDEISPTAEEESELTKRARTGLEALYENFTDPKERTEEIIRKMEPFFQHFDKEILPDDKIEEFKKNIDALSLIQDKDEYLDIVMKTLKPILDLRDKHADKFENAQAKAMNETHNFTEINRLISYGKSGPMIHIHAPAGETVSNKFGLYRDGMKKLAEIVDSDPEIQEITATSTIVAEHPGLFTRIGFKVEDINEEFRNKYFAGEQREIKRASISREEFLNRFLKNKSTNQ